MILSMLMKNLSKTILFMVTPFLMVPGVFMGIYRKNIFNFILLALFFGVLQYLYVSTDASDLYRHYLAFDELKQTNWNGYLSYLTLRPDAIFYGLMFFFGKLGLSAQVLFFCITSFTAGSFFFIFTKIADVNYFRRREYLFAFFLILFSFSYPQLLSGVRFYFAAAICSLGFYYGILGKKPKRGLLFMMLAIFTHFSMLAFLPIYLLLRFFPSQAIIFKILFFASFVFWLIPQSQIVEILNLLGVTQMFSSKVDAYTEGQDIVERGIQNNSSLVILYLVKRYAWLFFCYFYLLLTIKRKSIWRNLCFGMIFIVNATYQFDFVSYRYSLFFAFIFGLLMIQEMLQYKNKTFFYILLGLYFMTSIVDVITMRDNLWLSYVSLESSNIISILLIKITAQDFIHI